MTDNEWVHVRPLGISSATTWRQIADITNFLYDTKNKLNLVVEIGANFGGFSSLMVARKLVFPDFRYIGIEIVEGRFDRNLLASMNEMPGMILREDDCFKPKVIQLVGEALKVNPGQALIFIDGTDKPKEMAAYLPLMRVGDYMLLHDYQEVIDESVPTNPSRKDVEPLLASGKFIEARPDYWFPGGMFLMKRVE